MPRTYWDGETVSAFRKIFGAYCSDEESINDERLSVDENTTMSGRAKKWGGDGHITSPTSSAPGKSS